MPSFYQKQIALGSIVEICLVADNQKQVDNLFIKLWKKIFSFERQFSRFLPTSELSIFNKNAGIKQTISEEFKDLLIKIKEISKKTEGLYNPFILPVLQKSGYLHSLVNEYKNDEVDDFSYRAVSNISKLEVGVDWALIPYNTALDLGGCGKGYLADLLGEFIHSKVVGYWISLGGDLICGGLDHNNKAWSIQIEKAKPYLKEAYFENKTGQNIAVATSGINRRKGIKNKQKWHHLIDPRTLKPSQENIELATIIDKSCLVADILASCLVIHGTKDIVNYGINNNLQNFLVQYKDGNQIKYLKYGNKIKYK